MPESVARPDQVDRIMADWERERPDLDVSPLAVLSRVTRLARHLDRVRKRAFAAHDLEPFEFDVLAALRRSGEPYQMSPSQLIAETLVTSGTMTNRIDRLAAKNLVARLADPRDRRGVLVELTATGRAAVDAAMAELLAGEHLLLDQIEPAEREHTATVLRRLVNGVSGQYS